MLKFVSDNLDCPAGRGEYHVWLELGCGQGLEPRPCAAAETQSCTPVDGAGSSWSLGSDDSLAGL